MATLTDKFKELDAMVSAINQRLEDSAISYEKMQTQMESIVALAKQTQSAFEKSSDAITNASLAVEKGAAGFAGVSGGYGSTAADGAAFVSAQSKVNASAQKILGLQELVDKLGKDAWDSQRKSYQATIDANKQFIASNQAQLAILKDQKAKLEQTGVDSKGNAVPIAGNAELAEKTQLQINQYLSSLQQYEKMSKVAEDNIKILDSLISDKSTTNEWSSAIEELKSFSKDLSSGKYTENSSQDQNQIQTVLNQLVNDWNNNKPIKTYNINVNGSTIRTIDDPEDIIRLIEQLSKSKRVAL